MTHSDGLFPTLLSDLHQLLRQWSAPELDESPVAYLPLYQAYRRQGLSVRQATHELLGMLLERLAQTHSLEAALLQHRFHQRHTVQQAANHFGWAVSTLYAKQRQAIAALAETVTQLEEERFQARQGRLAERLPQIGALVGVDALLEQLLTPLALQGAPWVLTLEGLGGIGKTTLAAALLQRAVAQGLFDHFAWVHLKRHIFRVEGAPPQQEPEPSTLAELFDDLSLQLLGERATAFMSAEEGFYQVQRALKQTPHLIVIDNLESLAEVERLLPRLERLTDPTKFILTTRESLWTSPLYRVVVPPLSSQDALRLFHQEAAQRNLPDLLEVGAGQFAAVYETVGGNPLALRLVVGLGHVYELGTILQDLVAARGQPVENLYTFIYRRSWDSLSEAGRRVLLAMPFVTTLGGKLSQLEAISRVEPATLRQLLNHLVSLNLIDVQGGAQDRRYRIHPLTRSFLQQQVAQWE